ncbi:MAG: prepilin-type N-terminal cleavage/methylation domain-containing protein, partial [Ottowia sp.]|nr:prepilin-type N-terminal cleavage/methylation domain-containing protein [Ottowia sp.]
MTRGFTLIEVMVALTIT